MVKAELHKCSFFFGNKVFYSTYFLTISTWRCRSCWKRSFFIGTNAYFFDLYESKYEKYFGENIFIDQEIKYEWARIPHFYSDFYVYKYVTGLCAACYIADGILNNKENALENYLKFLKTGGSNYPLEELKVAGVDMTDSKVIERTIKMFDSYIDKFKELYNS